MIESDKLPGRGLNTAQFYRPHLKKFPTLGFLQRYNHIGSGKKPSRIN